VVLLIPATVLSRVFITARGIMTNPSQNELLKNTRALYGSLFFPRETPWWRSFDLNPFHKLLENPRAYLRKKCEGAYVHTNGA